MMLAYQIYNVPKKTDTIIMEQLKQNKNGENETNLVYPIFNESEQRRKTVQQ